MVENKELCNKLVMKEVSYDEAVPQMISAEKYAEEVKITLVFIFFIVHSIVPPGEIHPLSMNNSHAKSYSP